MSTFVVILAVLGGLFLGLLLAYGWLCLSVWFCAHQGDQKEGASWWQR